VHNYYHHFTIWLHGHPQWGSVVAFVIAFAECIPLLGTIIPGSITMTAIGVLVGSGVMPLFATLACATIGAVAGDSIGLLIGYYYKDHLKRMWPFRKYPKMLERGQHFIAQHGGKSIFIGRFVGAIRAFVPLVAGMLEIPPLRFYLVDVVSALCWAIAYMLPGFLLGVASLEIPAEMAAKVILLILSALVVLWVATMILKACSKWIYRNFNAVADAIWQRLNSRPKGHAICKLLRYPEQKTESGQLALAAFTLILAGLFIVLWLNVIFHGTLTDWNQPFYHLFRGMYAPGMSKIMLTITTLGQKTVLLPLGMTLFVYLLVTRQWRAAAHWVALVILVTACAYGVKHLHVNARPPGLLNGPINSSFPSGHVSLAVALYGFIGFLLARSLPDWRKTIYWAVVTICFFVALSRLYLGAHWLTDVVGATLLASTLLCAVVIAYRRERVRQINWIGVLATTIITLACFGSWYLDKNFRLLTQDYQPVWPEYQMTANNWWNQQGANIPLYRAGRLGQAQQILNVQWSDSLENIISSLAANGWRDVPVNNFFSLFERITNEDKVKHITIIEELKNDQQPAYIGIRATDTGQPAILFLWNANITLEPDSQPLWVGAVYYQTVHHYSLAHQNQNIETQSAIEELIPSLKNYDYKEEVINEKQLPLSFSLKPHSPYVLTLIRPKNTNFLSMLNQTTTRQR
jgi:membrane protein DedA with SNARE-associated domain/membrane-associated phospholipid phosphatase